MGDLSPGFADPAADAQSCFRTILDALCRPGQVVSLPVTLTPPRPLSRAAAAILLALVDPTVRVSLPPGTEAARAWLAFHRGVQCTPPAEADFIFALARPPLASLRAGSDDEPEQGATLLLDLPRFGAGRRYLLTGPGIETVASLHAPLDATFAAEWRVMRAAWPRGIDIFLCAGAEVIGLPRSLAIVEAA